MEQFNFRLLQFYGQQEQDDVIKHDDGRQPNDTPEDEPDDAD